VSEVLRDLRNTVEAVHAAAVVIGDFNDLNVLVDDGRAYLIDADSYQYGGFPCTVFSERFVDPCLCDPAAGRPVLASPHTAESDWYAFAVIAMRSLLCVGPYGGVFRPVKKRLVVPHAARPLHRITVFRPDVIYPKPAIHYRVLPDDFLHHLQQVFEKDVRGAFPTPLLEGLRWTRCTDCGFEHARLVCPNCSGARRTAARASLRVRGDVTAETVFRTRGQIVDSQLVEGGLFWLHVRDGVLYRGDAASAAGSRDSASTDGVRLGEIDLAPNRRIRCFGDGALVCEGGRVLGLGEGSGEILFTDSCGTHTAAEAVGPRRYWVQGGRLLRDGRWGPELIGAVLTGQTRFWVSEDLGFGYYRAGSLNVGFVFDPERTGIDDRVALPRPRGSLVDAHCVLGRDHVWFFATEDCAGRMVARCVLVGGDGATRAAAEARAEEETWLSSARSACAVGDFLFLATDRGVVRVERDGDSLVETRCFADTEPFVDASCRLHAGARGLYVVARDRIVRLALEQKGVAK
jgi:hypothetical protein